MWVSSSGEAKLLLTAIHCLLYLLYFALLRFIVPQMMGKGVTPTPLEWHKLHEQGIINSCTEGQINSDTEVQRYLAIAAYSYTLSVVVGLFVCVPVCLSVGHVREPYENGWIVRDALWKGWLGSDGAPIPQGEGAILRWKSGGPLWIIGTLYS